MSHVNSALFTGTVRHRRFHPVDNHLEYRAFMVWLNLDDVDDVLSRTTLWGMQRWALARFCREDYFTLKDHKSAHPSNSIQDLKDHVCSAFERESGHRPQTICMMTNLRYFGFLINPVTFYYAYDAQENLLGILSEITNTPWDERFHYTLLASKRAADVGNRRGIAAEHIHTKSDGDRHTRYRYVFDKVFHVSPFNPLNMTYVWSMPEITTQCFIHMQTFNHEVPHTDSDKSEQAPQMRKGRLDFDATMVMQRHALNAATMRKALLQYPFMTLKVMWGIYSNAMRLWFKKSPFYDHPKNDPFAANGHTNSNTHSPENDLQTKLQTNLQPKQK